MAVLRHRARDLGLGRDGSDVAAVGAAHPGVHRRPGEGVRAQGNRSMLLAALLVPEMIYNMFAQVVYVTALYKAFRGGPSAWHET